MHKMRHTLGPPLPITDSLSSLPAYHLDEDEDE